MFFVFSMDPPIGYCHNFNGQKNRLIANLSNEFPNLQGSIIDSINPTVAPIKRYMTNKINSIIDANDIFSDTPTYSLGSRSSRLPGLRSVTRA